MIAIQGGNRKDTVESKKKRGRKTEKTLSRRKQISQYTPLYLQTYDVFPLNA